MNDTTTTSDESLPFLLLSHQNNAASELRQAMNSLRLVESYLNQGELLLRSLIRNNEQGPKFPQMEPQTPFEVTFHEKDTPPMTPLLLPSRRSSHNLLKPTNTAPPRLPKSAHRRPPKPLEEDTLPDDDGESSHPTQETKHSRPLRRITKRIPPPRIADSLKAEVQATGLPIDHEDHMPSSPKVKSTVFLVIEDGVATTHQLSKSLLRNQHEAKKKNVLQRVVGWVFRRDA
ncbi:hypothetical protein DFS33DRAFT_1388793 [Desarmillaria ectypa]|nr:hypothetical protein DFS33DRAFT_1388793 [Desarmillaria ectypa]